MVSDFNLLLMSVCDAPIWVQCNLVIELLRAKGDYNFKNFEE